MSDQRFFVVMPTTPDGETTARLALIFEVNRLMKSGAVGYNDAIEALLAITGATIAMFAAQDAEILLASVAETLDGHIKDALKSPAMQAIRAQIAARSVMN